MILLAPRTCLIGGCGQETRVMFRFVALPQVKQTRPAFGNFSLFFGV